MAAVVLISGAGALGVAMTGAVTGDVEIGDIGALLWQLIRTESSPDLTSSSPMPVSLTSSMSFLMRRVSMVSLFKSVCWCLGGCYQLDM